MVVDKRWVDGNWLDIIGFTGKRLIDVKNAFLRIPSGIAWKGRLGIFS